MHHIDQSPNSKVTEGFPDAGKVPTLRNEFGMILMRGFYELQLSSVTVVLTLKMKEGTSCEKFLRYQSTGSTLVVQRTPFLPLHQYRERTGKQNTMKTLEKEV